VTFTPARHNPKSLWADQSPRDRRYQLQSTDATRVGARFLMASPQSSTRCRNDWHLQSLALRRRGRGPSSPPGLIGTN
jgi:hypothetical protein